MEKERERDLENEEEDSTLLQEKVVPATLYEKEVKKRKELEQKVVHLKKVIEEQQEKLSQMSQISETQEKSRETLIQELKTKYKFAYNIDRYPWMYDRSSIQSEEEGIEWFQEWGNFLFDYAKAFLIHIVDLSALVTEPPFTEFKRNREQYLKEIFTFLASKTPLAKWSNKEKTRLRIYWRSLEAWSEALYEYMYLNGTEIATLIDIKNEGEQIAAGFATLPAPDIGQIINLLIKDRKAAWIDKKTVKFYLD